MPTIAKQPNGKFKAIIKAKGRILKIKTFIRKTDARAWAKRIEADHEAIVSAAPKPRLFAAVSASHQE